MALKTLRLQLRFLLPLVAVLVAAAYLAVPLMDQVTLRWFSRDLNGRGLVVAHALSDSVTQALAQQGLARLRPLFERTAQDERLYALALCSPEGRLLQSTERFPESLSCESAMLLSAQAEPRLHLRGGAVHIGVQPIMGPPPVSLPVLFDEPPAARHAARQAAASAAAAAASSPADADDGPRELKAGLVLLHDLS
ncbi:MAG: hypothetical protein KA141_04070, partial [Rubrivivax sp.]|nr:hypothetical protein [Rubrivivax sp.]